MSAIYTKVRLGSGIEKQMRLNLTRFLEASIPHLAGHIRIEIARL